MYATDKQMKFVNDIRVTLADYDILVGDKPHEVVDANTAWNMTKQEASKFISKNKDEFSRCLKVLNTRAEEL